MLYSQDPPNDGVWVELGSLGIDFESNNGMDIGGSSNNAFAMLNTGSGAAIFTLKLQTGKASKVAHFGMEENAMALGLGF